jgi:hypothetical protein
VIVAAALAACSKTGSTIPKATPAPTTVKVTLAAPTQSVGDASTAVVTEDPIATLEATVEPTATPKPTKAPTAKPTAKPTPAGTSWADFVSHENDIDEVWMADMQVVQDDLSYNDLTSAEIDALVVAMDDADELAWLKANPPLPCYSDLHSLLITVHKESQTAMTDMANGNFNGFTTHITKATAALTKATAAMTHDGAVCSADLA